MAYYKTKRTFTPGEGLPLVSTDLDSVRTYQWEIVFGGLPGTITSEEELTLAAKKVTGLEISVENKTIDRVNDRLNYPGKATLGEAVITFDNLYNRETASDLFRWFQTIYDPVTGLQTRFSRPGGGGGTFKAEKVEIIMLDNTMNPHSTIELYGVYPTKWSASELNYSTSDFHTVELSLKYDFMNTFNYSNKPSNPFGSIIG